MPFLSIFDLKRHAKTGSIFLILMSFTILGCAHPKVQIYCDDKIDTSKLAVIRVYEPTKEELKYVPDAELQERKGVVGIWIVDGSFTLNPLIIGFANGLGDVCILPGKHTLSVKVHVGTWTAQANLWLVAEPGEKYIIKALAKQRHVWTWIENERTGQPVGGIVGSDDEPKS